MCVIICTLFNTITTSLNYDIISCIYQLDSCAHNVKFFFVNGMVVSDTFDVYFCCHEC